MVIVDSSVWVDYLGGGHSRQSDWLNAAVGDQRLGLTDLILCEVLQGVRDDANFTRTRSALLRFQVFASGGVELALAAAANYRLLRKSGYTIRSTIDCVTATFCVAGGHRLLHRDRDFDAAESVLGLKVVQI